MSEVSVWVSTIDQEKKLKQEEPLPFLDGGAHPERDFKIVIDDAVAYQQMDGFGASFTDASAWLYEDELETVAFRNEDGTKVLIVLSRTAERKSFIVECGSHTFEYDIEGLAAVTFKW